MSISALRYDSTVVANSIHNRFVEVESKERTKQKIVYISKKDSDSLLFLFANTVLVESYLNDNINVYSLDSLDTYSVG
jgi:hypothetical protein